MDYNKRPKWWMALIATIVVSCLLLCGCKSVRTIEVEKVRTEYKSRVDTVVKKDSVWCHDSIMTYIDGDTKYVDRWHTKYENRYIYKVLQDTLLKTDTLTKVVNVTKKPSLWEETKDDMFVPLLVLTLCLGLVIWKDRQ